jgi:hypothetical protein
MRRIDVRATDPDNDARLQASTVVMRGDGPDGEVVVRSSDEVTYPGVWQEGERVYDVEVWRDGELVATVPPRSDDVDASFDQHERHADL